MDNEIGLLQSPSLVLRWCQRFSMGCTSADSRGHTKISNPLSWSYFWAFLLLCLGSLSGWNRILDSFFDERSASICNPEITSICQHLHIYLLIPSCFVFWTTPISSIPSCYSIFYSLIPTEIYTQLFSVSLPKYLSSVYYPFPRIVFHYPSINFGCIPRSFPGHTAPDHWKPPPILSVCCTSLSLNSSPGIFYAHFFLSEPKWLILVSFDQITLF